MDETAAVLDTMTTRVQVDPTTARHSQPLQRLPRLSRPREYACLAVTASALRQSRPICIRWTHKTTMHPICWPEPAKRSLVEAST